MRAAVHDRYGDPREVVEIRELERPEPAHDEVLVRVRNSALNIADWYGVVGRPYAARVALGVRRPKETRLGTDYAGVVEAVGEGVKDLAVSDEVFGAKTGSCAEFVVVGAGQAIARKPADVSFELAAATPLAAITALQALRDHGRLRAGQKVLINGASGGVGTYAVQIAKALGGNVTAVCSTPNVEIARSLGADRVVDYTQEDFTRSAESYDLMIDIAGTTPFSRLRRALHPDATVVVVGGPRAGRLLGPIGHLIRSRLSALRTSQRATSFLAKLGKDDLEVLRELLESGRLTSVIDSTYPLAEVGEALRHMGEGHPRGKIVVTC
jgi:NADPH:quinone reductase-like Zn-dependent oxidoreductase